MSNVVQFLETLARNPKPLSIEDLTAAVVGSGLDQVVQRALLDQNVESLSEVLGGRATMLCFIAPAEDEEPSKDDEPGDESEDESPSREAVSVAA